MHLTPQHKQILNLLADHNWHCGTELLKLFIKDDRKRISELRQQGFNIISEKCDCGRHKSGLVKRKLVDGRPYQIKESPKIEFQPVIEYGFHAKV